ncbi:MAG: cysteine desulfurase [Desulfobacteraceae bacterium]|nr:MAG: cysteine desulfurase [Desulfobacteraceae bacterium]
MIENTTKILYFDHNATTPVTAEAAAAMKSYLQDNFGNPSSAYPIGKRAREAIEKAREQTSSLLRCLPEEICFTSGGSESNNMVLKGSVDFRRPERFHIITSAVEHPAILNPLLYLMDLGVEVTIAPVDRYGRVDPDYIRMAIKPSTGLISIMLANNETGTLQPVKEIALMAGERGIPVHTDAAQAVGKIPVDVEDLRVDFLTVAGHKLYGPKGVGALYIRKGRRLNPLIHGAGQEMGRRAGTESTGLLAGLGAACSRAEKTLYQDMKMMAKLRDRLQEHLSGEIEDLVINGHPVERLPNTLHVSVPGLEGSKILAGIPGLMASTGAACHDRSVKLSHVLAAMGIPAPIGMGAIRLTLGRNTTKDEVDEAAGLLTAQIKRMRNERKNQ